MYTRKHIATTINQFINEQSQSFDEWYFVAEKELRNTTKNFDIDVDLEDIKENKDCDFVMAAGGMEHYIIFKDMESFEKNKKDYLDGYMYIEEDKPIKLSTAIAFRINFEEE